MNNKICVFFGHREIKGQENLRERLLVLVEELIREKEFGVFLFGGFGEFDELCHTVVSKLKEKYPTIKRVFCLNDERHLRKEKRPKYLRDEDYEEFTYLPLDYNYWYTRIYYRNCEMIDRSDYAIFYAEQKKESGAYKALQYAQKKKKPHSNLFYEKPTV